MNLARILGCVAVLACLGALVACSAGTGVEDDPVMSQPVDDIYTAAAEGDVETVRRIIASGNWDYGAADNAGKLPLEHAVEGGNPEIIAMMIQAGASPNIASREGKTMLQLAEEKGNAEAVEVLKQFGAR